MVTMVNNECTFEPLKCRLKHYEAKLKMKAGKPHNSFCANCSLVIEHFGLREDVKPKGEAKIMKICKNCGKPFEPKANNQAYCSKDCYKTVQIQKNREWHYKQEEVIQVKAKTEAKDKTNKNQEALTKILDSWLNDIEQTNRLITLNNEQIEGLKAENERLEALKNKVIMCHSDIENYINSQEADNGERIS